MSASAADVPIDVHGAEAGPFVTERPRIAGLLDQAIAPTSERATDSRRGPIILVSAPANTGKTSAVGAWVRTLRDVLTIEIAVSPAESMERIWRRCHERLEATDTRPAQIAGQLSSAGPSTDFADTARRLEQRLARSDRPVVLIVDDVDRLTDPVGVHSLDTFLAVLPAHVAVVLIARHDPPLSWHRYAREARFTRMGEDVLSLTVAEIRDVMLRQHTELTDGAAERLLFLTGGWAALVRVAANHLAGRSDVAGALDQLERSPRPVSDYLVGDLITALPADLFDFVSATAVLPEFEVELADAICSVDAARALRGLVDHNFPVVAGGLTSGIRSYTYPGIVRAYLRGELRTREPAAREQIITTAIAWSVRNRRNHGALRLALDLADGGVLETTLLECGLPMAIDGDLNHLLALLDSAHTVLAGSPVSPLLHALIACDTGDPDGASTHLDHAVALAPALDDPHPGDDAMTHLYRALLVQVSARIRGRDVVGLIPALDDPPSRAPDDLVIVGLIAAGIGCRAVGEHDSAERRLRRALALAEGAARPPLRVRVGTELARLAWCRGDALSMRSLAVSAMSLARTRAIGVHDIARCAATVAMADYLLGDRDDVAGAADLSFIGQPHQPGAVVVVDALTELSELIATFDRTAERYVSADRARRILAVMAADDPAPVPTCVLLMSVTHMCLAVGRPDRVTELIAIADRSHGPRPEAAVASAAVQVFHGRWESAHRTLAPVLCDAERLHPHTASSAWSLEAAVACELGETRAVHLALSAALGVADRTGVVAPLLEAGAAVTDALARDIGTFGHLDGLADRVLLLATTSDRVDHARLTPSEMRVLSMLPSAKTAGEIAELLSVSVNTVKTHMRGVYRKLGVGSRRDAVSVARSTGLI
ncbi:LuxR C-terminal-related transcriptional regulator [Gordonia sp. DT101]|uniref:LuxR C-terminal-related transcriptional regulator n=1 Tax=Gordonia sp. DT101 TaxID=3416545 RepID=UPI003CFB0990